MSTQHYARCPRCGRQNPVADPHAEHTCIFCGAIIPPAPEGKHEDARLKARVRKFPVEQSQTKPLNRNQSKPRFE